MSTDLILRKLEPACRMLAEAADAGQAKRVADLARAAEVYAKRQKLGKEAEQHASRIKVDALTLMGEFLRTGPKNKGAEGNPGGRGAKIERSHNGTTHAPTLSELGISKKESSEAQALARLRDEAPDLHEEVRTGQTTTAKAKQVVNRQKKRRRMESAAQQALASDDVPWEIRDGDCLERLAEIEARSVHLVFADPPYNIGVDYGAGVKADLLPEPKFVAWCGEWVEACVRVLAQTGTMWILIGDEYADHMGLVLRRAGLHRRAWVKWYETFGVNCANNFNRCSRHLFYCVKDPKQFTFNPDVVRRPSDRQTKYDDPRADPEGKIWDDVWEIPRLVGTAKERIDGFPTQLPLALLRPIIGCSSDPGDTVLDPFSGSATTGAAAVEMGRNFIGIEKNKDFAALARLRLKGVGNG